MCLLRIDINSYSYAIRSHVVLLKYWTVIYNLSHGKVLFSGKVLASIISKITATPLSDLKNVIYKNISLLSYLYNLNYKCSDISLETPSICVTYWLERTLNTQTISCCTAYYSMIGQLYVWELLLQGRAVICKIWGYQQVDMCTDDVEMS